MEHIHSLCLIGENKGKGYHPILYEKINHYTSENYAVIYTAQNDTMQAVRHMSQHGVKVKALVESGAFTIVGRDKVYYSVETTELDSHTLLNLWHKLMLNVKRRTSFKGILAIGSADAFFESSSHDKLVKYEEIVDKKFHIPLEAIFAATAQRLFRSCHLATSSRS
jgi:hypothetical protein